MAFLLRLPLLLFELLLRRLFGGDDATTYAPPPIDGRHRLLRLVAWAMNRRSRLTGIATGDQAIYVRRDEFRAVGGFPSIALMEDIALSSALRRRSPPACLRATVTTSGRR